MRADFGERGLISAYLQGKKKATYFFPRSKTIIKSTFRLRNQIPSILFIWTLANTAVHLYHLATT